MTSPTPTIPHLQPWDENRWREALRSNKPFSPKLKTILENLHECFMAQDRACAEYQFEAAITRTPDLSRLRVTARRLEKARHEALVALGQDPNSPEVLPFAPTIPHDA